MLTQVARSIYCLIFLNVNAFEILKENVRMYETVHTVYLLILHLKPRLASRFAAHNGSKNSKT